MRQNEPRESDPIPHPTNETCDVCGCSPGDHDVDGMWQNVKYEYKDSVRFDVECPGCFKGQTQRNDERDREKFNARVR